MQTVTKLDGPSAPLCDAVVLDGAREGLSLRQCFTRLPQRHERSTAPGLAADPPSLRDPHARESRPNTHRFGLAPHFRRA
jgi:hypothetical protein